MKKFRIAMSERCFRFKPDALPSHAAALGLELLVWRRWLSDPSLPTLPLAGDGVLAVSSSFGALSRAAAVARAGRTRFAVG